MNKRFCMYYRYVIMSIAGRIAVSTTGGKPRVALTVSVRRSGKPEHSAGNMHSSLPMLLLLLLSVAVVGGNKQYTLNIRKDSGFNVTIADQTSQSQTLVLEHSVESPMLYVGLDQQTIAEFRGNFRIQDYVIDRIGLPDFTVSTTATTDTIHFRFGSVAVNMTLTSSATHPLAVSLATDPTYGATWVRVPATPEEKVYGLGEQYSYLNLRSRTYPIWTREQGVGRNKSDIVTFLADTLGGGAGGDYHTTYFPQPTFVSSRRYYCHYGGRNYAEYDFRSKKFHEIYVIGDLSPFYFYADSIKGAVSHLSGYLGRQPELPDWVYTGAILGVQGGTDTMMERYDTAVANGVPVSGLWIQDWSGAIKTSFGSRVYWDWKWNATHYPGLNSTIAQLRDKGVRVLAYINPNLIVGGELYTEAASKRLLVRNKSGAPYVTDFGEFQCGTVDLSGPAGFDWYKKKIQENMIDLGLGGWMADFGEYLPADGAVFASNQSGKALHNEWPVLWARCNREALEERNATGDVVFFMRAGAAGTGNYTTLMWAGDQNVDFSYGDGLPSTVPAALGLGLSGVGVTHIDVGGYTTAAQFQAAGKSLVRTEELLMRSAEAAVFSPMFRSHEGNQPRFNVQFYSSPDIEKQFARYAAMFVHISNYTRHLVQQNSLFGVPVQRPLFMEFPDDVTSWSVTYQFMFGPDILVAPVIQSKVTSKKVYLPPGTWRFFWNTQTYTSNGTFVTVDAPIGNPPAFYLKTSNFSTTFDEIRTKFPALPSRVSTATPVRPTTTTTSSPCTGGGSKATPTAGLLQYTVFALAIKPLWHRFSTFF